VGEKLTGGKPAENQFSTTYGEPTPERGGPYFFLGLTFLCARAMCPGSACALIRIPHSGQVVIATPAIT
jgi:hypothetical protein